MINAHICNSEILDRVFETSTRCISYKIMICKRNMYNFEGKKGFLRYALKIFFPQGSQRIFRGGEGLTNY